MPMHVSLYIRRSCQEEGSIHGVAGLQKEKEKKRRREKLEIKTIQG
jgi:hypothetical protein